jgi:hypothetical protein
MYPDYTEQLFDKRQRLHAMNNEFVTILTPVELKCDVNLDEIVLSVNYGILEDHNFFSIIHKYDFEISTIMYNKHTFRGSLRNSLSKLLIILEDRKEFT